MSDWSGRLRVRESGSEARARLRARGWNLGKTGRRFVRPRSETRLLDVGRYVTELKKVSFLRNRSWMDGCVDVDDDDDRMEKRISSMPEEEECKRQLAAVDPRRGITNTAQERE